VIWQKLSHGGKLGCMSGVAASIVGAMGIGMAVGAMLGGPLGFVLVGGIIIVLGACVGTAVGHAIQLFDIWRTLKLGGKLGGVLGVLVATVPALYAGSAAWAAIEIKFGEKTLSNPPGLVILLLAYTLAMDATLVIGFGAGSALGHLINRFFGSNPRESMA
jgi:hypothetical protein